MPTFGESPPGLVARFDELAALAAGAERREIFGYPSCVWHGNMFMGLFGSSIGIKLAEGDRATLSAIEGAEPFGPEERPMSGYVAIPASWRAT